ncbi:MAG TPA: M13 family metallopeptidase N-terminal domain-containing protein, partial [Labilithrix sp.]
MRKLLLSIVLAFVACSPAAPPAPPPPIASAPVVTPPPPAPEPKSGIKNGMDPRVAPGDDFFAYANGGWVASTEIPKDRSHWGTFGELAEVTNERTAKIIRELGEGGGAASSPDAKKIADTYATFMDEAAIERKGFVPLELALADVARIKDKTSLARALGETVRADVDILNNTEMHTDNIVGLWVAEDLDEPTKVAAFLIQGGLGMPDREYYLDASPRMADARAKYVAHIEAVLGLTKEKDAKAKAARIFELEKKIAQTHATREDASDVEKGNNHWSRADLDKKAPGMDWRSFLAGAKLDKQPVFVAWTPSAVSGLSALVAKEPLATWKDYLAFHLLDRASPVMARAFAEEHFAFYDKALHGIEQQRDRWK